MACLFDHFCRLYNTFRDGQGKYHIHYVCIRFLYIQIEFSREI